jgi:alpha-L-arabinofuranosidase
VRQTVLPKEVDTVIAARIAVDATRPIGAIHPHLYGHFIEHLRECIYHGLWAEMLSNRKFGGHDAVYFGIVLPWLPIGPSEAVEYRHDNRISYVPGMAGRGQSQRIRLSQSDGAPHGVAHGGLGLVAGREYAVRLVLRAEELAGPVTVSLGGPAGEPARATIDGAGGEWRTVELTLTAPSDERDGYLAITITDPGTLWLGAASLMPADNIGGWRRDVLELVRGLKPPIVRYPGGNFVSGYHWRDGIGDRDRRPVRYDEAWDVFEPNDVGVDEFIAWCRLLGTEPYLCVNTGDGTPEEAAAWVEYCNGPADSPNGALRAANGHPEPYDVIYWGVGNETYGNWQIGHVDAEAFAHECIDVARAMRAVDPRLKILAVGAMPDRWPGWNKTVARIAGDEIDYITLHHYARESPGTDPATAYLLTVAAPERIEDLIGRSRRDIDAGSPGKAIPISFDEWNVAHRNLYQAADVPTDDPVERLPPLDTLPLRQIARAAQETFALMPLPAGVTEADPDDELRGDEVAATYTPRRWTLFLTGLRKYIAQAGGMTRQNYALADGLYAASLFNVFLRHADHVTMANQAQMVNLLGLIETSQTDCYGTPQYLAYQLYVDHGQGRSLAVRVEGPTFDQPGAGNMPARPGVPWVDVAASHDPAGARLVLHIVNRHPTEELEAEIAIDGLAPAGTATAHVLHGAEVWTRNSHDDHRRVTLTSRPAGAASARMTVRLPAHSATALDLPCPAQES